MRFLRTCVFWLLALTVGNHGMAAEQVESLLRFLPTASNGLVIVRVNELLNSPRAQRENWRKNEDRFLAGADAIPAWVELIVIGTAFQPGITGDDWSAAVIPLPANTTVESIAGYEGIPLQSIGKTPAFYSPRNGYVIQLANGVAGVMSPAQRQNAARWIREVQSARRSPLSDYLEQAARQPDQIVMALDMLDMLDPDVLRRRLEAAPALQGKADDVRRVVDGLQGLRGMTLKVNVRNNTEAQLTVDFSAPPPLPASELKALFLNMLSDEGAELAEVNDALASVQGNALLLSLQLSDQGLRRIMALGLAPFPNQPGNAPAAAGPTNASGSAAASEQTKTATRKYFASVGRVLDDLGTRLSLTSQTVAIWIDQGATTIDNLPTRDVDADMLRFGADVSSKLRALNASLRGTRVAVNTEQQTLTYNVQVGAVPVSGWGRSWYGWPRAYGWGSTMVPYYQTQSNLADVRQNQAQAIRAGEGEREKIWQSITDSRAAIRLQMIQRYGEGFQGGKY